MSVSYINPALPSMIRGLYRADLREKSIQNMLDLAADLVQELIDLRAEQGTEEPEWEWGSAGKEGISDPDPRPLEDDRPYWPKHLTGVRELTREQAESVIAAWNEGDPESAFLIRRRKAGPWEAVPAAENNEREEKS